MQSLKRLICSQQSYIMIVLLLLYFFMSVSTESFGTANNLSNIARNASFFGIMAIGQTLVIISGGIDLSVGSVMALAGVIFAQLLQSGHSLYFSISATLLIAALVGVVHWVFISKAKISSFVVTLASMSIGRSLAIVISDNKTLYELGEQGDLFTELCNHVFWGLAFPSWILILLLFVSSFLLAQTRFGLHLFAIGANEDATKRSGLSTDRIKLAAYVLSSLSAGTSAILLVGHLGSVTSSLGVGNELTVVAASVIGGASLIGGYGSTFGAVLGSLLMEAIRNALVIYGINPFFQGAFIGLFILLAVWISNLSAQRD